MSETKAVRVAHVKYAGEYTLRLRWVNRKTMSVDLREPVQSIEGFAPTTGSGGFCACREGRRRTQRDMAR